MCRMKPSDTPALRRCEAICVLGCTMQALDSLIADGRLDAVLDTHDRVCVTADSVDRLAGSPDWTRDPWAPSTVPLLTEASLLTVEQQHDLADRIWSMEPLSDDEQDALADAVYDARRVP